MNKKYIEELDATDNYFEHMKIWIKIIGRIRSDKSIERLIVESDKYYFKVKPIRKLFTGSKKVKSFENPYIKVLFKEEPNTNFFSNNPDSVIKFDKYLKDVAISAVPTILPIEVLDNYSRDIMWDFFSFIFTLNPVENDNQLKPIMEKYLVKLLDVREYEDHHIFRLVLRRISLGLLDNITEIKRIFMVDLVDVYNNDDLLSVIRNYILDDVLDLSEIRRKYFFNKVDFLVEAEFIDFCETIKNDDEISLYIVAQ